MIRTTIVLSLMIFATYGYASPEHHTPPKVSKTFQQLTALVGEWEGKTTMNGKEEEIKVVYELTSGGTALIEKMAPGTPHEMITVYANRGNQINATHFCMLGNQPEMRLKKQQGNQFQFEMSGTKGISNKNEMHMHGVTLTFEGNKLKQEWTNYKDNKKGDTAVFEFTRS